MSTSVPERILLRRLARRYLLIAAFCGVFSAVYEYFSHGVLSLYMVLLFAFPLAGALAFFLLSRSPEPPPDRMIRGFWHAGIAALGTGSCLAGILEIYGTTSPYLTVYWLTGALALTAGTARFLLRR